MDFNTMKNIIGYIGEAENIYTRKKNVFFRFGPLVKWYVGDTQQVKDVTKVYGINSWNIKKIRDVYADIAPKPYHSRADALTALPLLQEQLEKVVKSRKLDADPSYYNFTGERQTVKDKDFKKPPGVSYTSSSNVFYPFRVVIKSKDKKSFILGQYATWLEASYWRTRYILDNGTRTQKRKIDPFFEELRENRRTPYMFFLDKAVEQNIPFDRNNFHG
jgi:hypothetical protein